MEGPEGVHRGFLNEGSTEGVGGEGEEVMEGSFKGVDGSLRVR